MIQNFFNPKLFLGPKILSGQETFLCQKYFDQKVLWSKFFGSNKILIKKIWIKKVFGSKKFGIKKKIGQRIFLTKKTFVKKVVYD